VVSNDPHCFVVQLWTISSINAPGTLLWAMNCLAKYRAGPAARAGAIRAATKRF
jgi:hypothetical protein